ncbi:hypothetical protein ASA1KI_43200 [Opitutales bacterium ASA1]|uniref:EamA family transporter n=1 Tax=Congregicoccus parvus TaxID=3081749 RepID=UPI002B2D159D|nr:hypothetical protein ASA1KI_43200 [Opitutales bacterium ASA1]
MFPALLTALLFSINAVFARRSALLLGSTAGNWWRLALAAVVLAAWVGFAGRGRGLALEWFLLSGIAGFGVGGLAMFHALPRAGSALSMLVVQCGSAVVALVLEWVWLGTRLNTATLSAIAVVLVGVALGLAPRAWPRLPMRSLALGGALAVLSALGQGTGAVLSRRAFAEVRRIAGDATAVDAGTAAFERVLGGLLVASAAWIVVVVWIRVRRSRGTPAVRTARVWPWVLANALAGPVLGVTCFQWALRTTPAAVVQSVVALVPLLTVLFAWRFGEDVPRVRWFFGATLAAVGTAGLFLLR